MKQPFQEFKTYKMSDKEKNEVAEAQALLEAKGREEGEAFLNAYQELSKKHGHAMSAYVTISASGVVPSLEVIKI